ncbi:acyl-CoA dehydrogenase family protein [Alistipes sp. ZOR0009]|uniref:acyl-CoA dehydrogenase family protein n=1 Tax=Alistipes sp. ZOR0009 TaxID=1339253 RepID=UPI000645DCAB|nr:acyl-CoA dehydrogenase family protein [Alistipes sp. ZOR0009]
MKEYLKEHHCSIKQLVKKFAETEVRPLAKEIDRQEEFSTHLTKRMGELGLFGIAIPEQYGGKGLDYMSFIVAVEELAKVDGSQASTLAAHNALGIMPIYKYGTEAQKMKYLPQLCTGNHTWAFGLTERNAGSDSRATESKAVLKDGKWHINGAKTFISNAASSVSLGVSAQVITNESNGVKELSVILIEKGTAGYTTEPIKGKMMWRGSDTGSLTFDNVAVPQENLLGELGKGAKIMLETLDAGRLSIAAMGVGLAQGAYEMALEYANKRIQFGKPIAKFQAISFKLAEMATKIEAARSLLYHAVWLKDNNEPYGKEAAMAKLFCSEIAREVANEAVQIHGAWGLVDAYDVERFYRDQRLLEIGEGTSEILKLVISRSIL